MNAMTNRIGMGTVHANGHDIHYVDNGAGWRYATLLDKEPETIEWIDSFAPGDIFWDIGANVGIYSAYAGVRGIRTLAFEPHFANYHQLCMNVGLNNLQDHVMPLCLAFTDRKATAEMNLASIDVGASMSNFGEAVDFRGTPFVPAFRQGMIGYDIDSYIADFGVEVPTHIKIDVDGIELPIVQGARRTLADPRVKSVSIELIETDIAQVEAVTAILAEAGLRFVHKKQNIAFSTADTMDVLNFLYCRDSHLAAIEKIADKRAAAGALRDADPEAMIARIVSQVVSRIGEASVDPEPTANIYMTDMLPDDIYAELQARLPADDALDPIVHPDAVAADGRITRRLLDLTPATIRRFDEADQPFWEQMIALFSAPALTAAVIEKFRPTLTARFGDTIPDLVAVPVFYRDYPGYRISIHPDMAGKIATLQFYLPENDSQRHLGTAFHKRTINGFKRLKTNAFMPNSAYAFVRTDESWHSVDELAPHEKIRNTIALTFYIRGEEYRSDAMMTTMESVPAKSATDQRAEMEKVLSDLAAGFHGAEDIAVLLRADGIGVNLGVGDGRLAAKLLSRSDVCCLYAVDTWHPGNDDHKNAIKALNPHRDRSVLLRMGQDEALDMFADQTVDFLFLGGTGDEEECGIALIDWYPTVRDVGIIAGDRYGAEWPALTATIDAVIEHYGLTLHVVECRNDSGPSGQAWFAMKRQA